MPPAKTGPRAKGSPADVPTAANESEHAQEPGKRQAALAGLDRKGVSGFTFPDAWAGKP